MITHIKDPNSDTCFVFVHGLGGGINTFKKFSEYLNKKWRLDYGAIVLFFRYYKEFFLQRLDFSLVDKLLFIFKVLFAKSNLHNARKLEKFIDLNCRDCNNIIIIAHSMGGLVSRQYLVNCRNNQKDIRKIKMLVTYGTPHNGSHIADIITSFSRIPIVKQFYYIISKLSNCRIIPQLGDLSSFSAFINNLNLQWRDLRLDSKIKFIRVIAKYDQFVKADSAKLHNEDFGNIEEFEYDHFTLITPTEKAEQFPPIDILFERIAILSFTEEYFEELDEEINYDDTENDTF